MMMVSRYILICLMLLLASCSSMDPPETPKTTINQLVGIWSNASSSASLHFYNDETVKLLFPKHKPPVKTISSYQTIKDQRMGIALGGFWTGPMMVDISYLAKGKLIVSFPKEDPMIFHRQ